MNVSAAVAYDAKLQSRIVHAIVSFLYVRTDDTMFVFDDVSEREELIAYAGITDENHRVVRRLFGAVVPETVLRITKKKQHGITTLQHAKHGYEIFFEQKTQENETKCENSA